MEGTVAQAEVRRDIPAAELNAADPADFAGKDKSFPILKPEDVAAAAASIGRAGPGNYDTDELKARIIALAKRKGPAYVAQLPEAWKDGAEHGGEGRSMSTLSSATPWDRGLDAVRSNPTTARTLNAMRGRRG
jgi:hypothetical protein